MTLKIEARPQNVNQFKVLPMLTKYFNLKAISTKLQNIVHKQSLSLSHEKFINSRSCTWSPYLRIYKVWHRWLDGHGQMLTHIQVTRNLSKSRGPHHPPGLGWGGGGGARVN